MNEEAKTPKDFAAQAKDPVDFLKCAIAYHIRDYCGKRDHNRRWAFWFKMYSVQMAACVTIILGLSSSSLFSGDDAFWDGAAIPYFSAAALVFSASVTVVSSWEAFAGYDWKWVRYRTTLADLYELKDDLAIRGLSAAKISPDEINTLYARLKQILSDTNVEWARRKTDPEKQKDATQSDPIIDGRRMADPEPQSVV